MTKYNDKYFKESLRFPLIFIALLWIVHLFKVFFHLSLGRFGVYPREVFGLKGIITGPIIHSDFQHLISNSVPLLILTTLIFLFYRKVAFKSFFVIYILTGLAVWAFANPGFEKAFHIGASGLVYGLVSFVFWSGIFRRNMKSIVLALIVIVLYSGLFFGILPNQPGISWESHLFGALVGIFVAYLFKDGIENEEDIDLYAPVEEEKEFFLGRDAFNKKT